MSIASEFHDWFEKQDKPNDFATTLARWMAQRDPKGRGKLDRKAGVVHYTFSDGSDVRLDIVTGELRRTQ